VHIGFKIANQGAGTNSLKIKDASDNKLDVIGFQKIKGSCK
jgi:hypothetical protein